MKQEIILSDSSMERIEAKWDDTRFAIVTYTKGTFPDERASKVIILTPKATVKLAGFIDKVFEGILDENTGV